MLAVLAVIARVAGVFALAGALGGGSAPTVASVGRAGAPPHGAIGRDVGSMSCDATLGSKVDFGIIATTAGRPYFPSPCLSAEYAWASRLRYRPQFYINLANPGHKSAHWGRGGPRHCDRHPKYDVGCAYDYGFEAAKTALGYVRAIGAIPRGRWWLDVEFDNTWGVTRKGIQANVAVIRGALEELRRQPHVSAGIYTETVWWAFITNGSTAFSHTAVWGGGAGSKRQAQRNCRPHSITGGPALLAQWIARGVDHDIAC
ncbi:MAG TPA: hypothetical protein VHB18_06305 [Mycobacteriales bacterium]|nr:hypothetical protein [Mycobacteriales bacterium]